MTTDIDALVAEAREAAETLDHIEYEGTAEVVRDLVTALTTERAKVTALEAQLAAERALSDAAIERGVITAWRPPNATRIAELEAENTHLRAALATSKSPCVYCQLPADEMAQCRSGFPGCARMDDVMGCPEFGAMMCLSDAQADATRWRSAAEELAVELNRIADVTERWTDSLVSQVNEIARAALARFKQESGQ